MKSVASKGKPVPGNDQTRRVVILARPPVDAFDVIGPAEAFGLANRFWPKEQRPYQVELVSTGPERAMPSEIGIGLQANATLETERKNTQPIDTLLIVSGIDNRNEYQADAVEWILKQAPKIRRLCSICVGAFTLAQTGLLDGKRATTHWAVADELASLYPAVKVDSRPIWIQDGDIYTSAGISSGIDLSVELIAQDLGNEFAMRIAKSLVLFLRRPGDQAQFSELIKSQAPTSASLQQLQLWIAEHLNRDLTLDILAHQIAVSRRTLIRLFKDELGITPAKYIERIRLEAAKRDIEMGIGDLQAVADRRGYGSVHVMWRSFMRNMGITPTQYADRFKVSAS